MVKWVIRGYLFRFMRNMNAYGIPWAYGIPMECLTPTPTRTTSGDAALLSISRVNSKWIQPSFHSGEWSKMITNNQPRKRGMHSRCKLFTVCPELPMEEAGLFHNQKVTYHSSRQIDVVIDDKPFDSAGIGLCINWRHQCILITKLP